MSLMFLGWILVLSSIAMFALILLPPRTLGARRELLDVEACKARLEEIDARLKRAEINKAEADAARLALLSQLRSSRWSFGPGFWRHARTLIAPAAVFLVVIGFGAAVFQAVDAPVGLRSADTSAALDGQSDAEMLARLADYTRSVSFAPAKGGEDELLPDVNVLIDRLAARLQTSPNDIEGWRTLGWSYFHTERYGEAATAFAKALELDPGSADLKQSYEEAKAKASGAGNSAVAPAGPGPEASAKREAIPPEHDAQIRSMVDGLAERLERSPRDIDGWTRLMRSRVVLGEKEVATAAFRKALDVFKDDEAASKKITAAATELGLNVE